MADVPQEPLVNVIDPDTQQVGSLPQSQAQEALAEGYQPASAQDVSNYFKEQKYGTAGQQIKTGLEGAASAATLGLSTGVEKSLGVNPEDIQARREVNPGVYTAGQITGLAATNLIPGLGEFADINEAANAAKAAVEAGTMTEQAAAPIISAAKAAINPLSAQSVMSGTAEKAVQALGLEGLGAHATRGAIETALFQGGDELSKAFSGDPNQSVQTAITNIGLAGLIGAPVGGLFGKVGDLLESKVNGKLGDFFEDARNRIQEHLDTPDPLSKMTEELTNHAEANEAFRDVYGTNGLKSEAIQKLMPNELSDKMVGQGQDLMTKAKNLVKNMESEPDLYPNYSRAAMAKATRILSEDLSQATEPGHVFNAIQDFKQRLGEALPQKGQIPTKADSEFIKAGRSLYNDFKTSLESPEVWGKAGDVQQTINKAFTEYLPAQKDFQRKFMTKVGNDFQIDPGKIQTYLNQTGKAGQKVKQDMLGNWIKSTENYRDAIGKVHDTLGTESPFKGSSLNYTKSTLNDLTPGARFADVVVGKALNRLSGEAIGGGIGGSIGHLFGAGGFGTLIGEHALAPFFTSIMPSLIKPLLSNETSGSGLRAAIKLGMNFLKGETLINKSIGNLFKSGQEVLPTKLIPDDKTLSKLDKQLKGLQNNPSPLINVGGSTGHYLPDHGSAIGQYAANATNYLNSQRPGISKMSPLDKEQEPTQIQKAAYNRTLSIAEQPLVVLQHIKDGTLNAKDVQDFNTLNPDLHHKLISKMTEEMTDHLSAENEIPYRTRMGLSLFMGEPLDSTLAPQGIQSVQNTFMMPPTPMQQQASPRGHKVALNSFKKLVAMDQTPLQKVSNKNA